MRDIYATNTIDIVDALRVGDELSQLLVIAPLLSCQLQRRVKFAELPSGYLTFLVWLIRLVRF